MKKILHKEDLIMSNNYTEKIAELERELNECEAELLVTRARCENLHKRRRYIKQKLDNVMEEARKNRIERANEYFNPMTDMEIIAVILSDGSIPGIKL